MQFFVRFFVITFILFFLSQTSALADLVGPYKPAPTHAVSVFGDVKYPPNFKHYEYVNPAAPKGGKITMPAIGNYNNLNPYILKGQSVGGVALLFDTLMTPSWDETGTNYGLVAKSVKLADDGSYIIFNLNPKAVFSDGSEVTADDVVFTYNALITKGHPAYQIYFAEIGELEKLGKYRVKFNFKNPENRELKFIIGQLPVLSKAYYDVENGGVDFEKTTLVAPLGSGPYKVKSLKQGREITYERRADYWAKDLPVNVGIYNFDKIKYEYYKDTDVAIQAFKSGKLDLRYENVAKNWANAYDIKAVHDGRIVKELIPHSIPTGIQAFALNTRKEKFADARVRKALNLAFDYEWMNKNLFYESYTRTSSYFSNSIYAATGLPSEFELKLLEPYRDQLPEEVFTQEFKQAKSDGSGRIRERLVEAAKLLEEAGWKLENNKLTKDGKQFEIEFLLQSGATMERLIPSLAKNLEQLGITSKIRAVEPSQYKQRTDEFDFDLIVNVWGQSNSPGNEQINYWHSSSAGTKGSMNYIGIKSPVVDALVNKIVYARDKENLITATHALDRVLLWNYYVIPQFYAGFFRILHWDKFAKPKTMPIYDAQFGLWTWWAKDAENNGGTKK
jgi:microcin C transport system substrate-binding protein